MSVGQYQSAWPWVNSQQMTSLSASLVQGQFLFGIIAKYSTYTISVNIKSLGGIISS